jgi:Protein of unknown function (DUF3179)
MSSFEIMAVVAVLLCALAILPGTLGILMLTNKIAADAAGARLIYQHSIKVLIFSAILMLVAFYQAYVSGPLSWLFIASMLAYSLVCVFGFLMHARLLFRPVRKPVFISVDEAVQKFGPEEEVVGVFDSAGKPFAFITRLARRPHIVYQPEGANPFLMTHCILSHSSMGYEMVGDFAQPDIIITAAMANNMVFYERSNKCAMTQMHNKPKGMDLPLKLLPTIAVSLRTWQALYPDTKVWVRAKDWRDTFYLTILARADVIDPESPVLVYPLQEKLDERLPMKSFVLGVEIEDQYKAYPVSIFDNERLIHDEMGNTSLLLVAAKKNDYLQIFDRNVGGQTLSFIAAETKRNFKDNETGSEWTPQGMCIAGDYEGTQLDRVPHYNKIFWFVWADYHPSTEIYLDVEANQVKAGATA